MATKQNIINKVDTDLASNSNIEATDHRGVLHGASDSIIDNFYGVKTFDYDRVAGTTSNVVTSTSNFEYDADITKNGTRVDISGIFINKSGTILPTGTTIFDITNPEYLMQNTNNNAIYTYSVLLNGFVLTINPIDITLQLINNTFRVIDAVPINSSIRFSLTYNTQN